jgi:hypothetical protein
MSSSLNPALLLHLYLHFEPTLRLYPTHDPKLRFHRLSFWRYNKTIEFIGWRLVRDEPEEGTDNHNILYYDVMGLMFYAYGYEEESDYGLYVDVECDTEWCVGSNLEELRAQHRAAFGSVPDFLAEPPEVEDMHTVTGYDS